MTEEEDDEEDNDKANCLAMRILCDTMYILKGTYGPIYKALC